MDEIDASFKNWWWNEGSGLRPINDEDMEEFAHRISKIAWSNGAFVMQNLCSKLCADASKPHPDEIQTDAQFAALMLAVEIQSITRKGEL
jgi:hypothetical protein